MQSLAMENYGTVEMSNEEQKETDGGILPLLLIVGAALLLEGCTGCQRRNVPTHGNPAPNN